MIYIDMDGVLVDFNAGVESLVGKVADPKKRWAKIYKHFPEGKGFYGSLPMMDDALELLNFFKAANTRILTSTGRYISSSRTEKVEWVKQHIGNFKVSDVITVTRSYEKACYCVSHADILVDDRPSNIEAWRESGGIGILHINASSTIKSVSNLWAEYD